MNFEAFLYYQEKHRQFLEEEEERKIIHIRKAEPSDVEGIQGLLLHLWPDYDLDKERQQNLIREDLRPNSPKNWFIANLNNNALGAISLRVVNVLWCDQPLLQIEELVVLPEFRKRGIGKRLLSTAEEFGKENNCYAMELDSGIARSEAHAFYLSIGFTEVSKYFSKRIT